MRIAIDVRHLASSQPSGVGHYTLELIRNFKELEHDHEFFLFASGSKKNTKNIEKLKELGFPVHYARIPNKLLSFKLKRGIVTLEDMLAFPVDAWFFPNLNFVHTKKPYFATLHDLSYLHFPDFYSPKMRLWHKLIKPEEFYKNAKSIISVSKSTAIDAENLLNTKNVQAISLAAGKDFHERERPQDMHVLKRLGLRKGYFLSLSTIEARKNHESIIDAYEIYRQSVSSHEQLVIAGQKGRGSRKLFNRIKKSPYKTDIIYLSYIPAEYRPAVMRHATALLFPSFMEGFGLPVAEALASGTPVITNSTTSLLDFGESGILHINAFNPQELAEAMRFAENETISVEAPKRSFKDVAEETLEMFK